MEKLNNLSAPSAKWKMKEHFACFMIAQNQNVCGTN